VTPELRPASGFSFEELADIFTRGYEGYFVPVRVDADSLEKELKHQFELSPGRKILLKGDETLSFVDVRTAMNIARKAGAKGVALGVEEVKDK